MGKKKQGRVAEDGIIFAVFMFSLKSVMKWGKRFGDIVKVFQAGVTPQPLVKREKIKGQNFQGEFLCFIAQVVFGLLE